MKQILPRIWQWSWFSEDKHMDFNGYLLATGEHRILVDPPPLTPIEMTQVRQGESIDYIVVTNRDHEREAQMLQATLQCRLLIPEGDAGDMSVQADKTFKDGELLPGGIWVIHLADQKSPGESALFLEYGKGVLIVGDALIGNPAGALSMLPAEKYADAAKAREGLRRLLKYSFDSLLVGDGVPILTNAKAAVEHVLHPS
ncbi:MAG: hypothetical protein NPIRA02_10340 [Nitrospirales bacterium]|nr:MAG: hypothetical protein NPIRA02_10340 [Nitrospirales bacterium]